MDTTETYIDAAARPEITADNATTYERRVLVLLDEHRWIRGGGLALSTIGKKTGLRGSELRLVLAALEEYCHVERVPHNPGSATWHLRLNERTSDLVAQIKIVEALASMGPVGSDDNGKPGWRDEVMAKIDQGEIDQSAAGSLMDATPSGDSDPRSLIDHDAAHAAGHAPEA